VHDDVCNILGGVAGHAGLFATAQDVAVIGQMLLNGGTYNGKRILSADILKRRCSPTSTRASPPSTPTARSRTADHGLGVELNQSWFMGKLASATSVRPHRLHRHVLLVSPARRQVIVVLTNRAHPNWSWSNPDTHRVAVHNAIATQR
jgi:CubicO group peptidase (beta-lactamase class C family)